MTEERRRYPFNRHLNWMVPPIDLQRRWNPLPPPDPPSPVIDGMDGERWSSTIRTSLDDLWHSAVGHALLCSVHKRTTLYHVPHAAQAAPDIWETEAGGEAAGMMVDEGNRRASRAPMVAALTVDLTRPPPPIGSAPTTRGSRLAHELTHVVTITWGAYSISGWDESVQHQRGSPSLEETVAWVVENMWRGERRMPYRSSYLQSRGLDRAPSTDSTGYPVSMLETLVVDHLTLRVPALAYRLLQLPTAAVPYNPFRDRYP